MCGRTFVALFVLGVVSLFMFHGGRIYERSQTRIPSRSAPRIVLETQKDPVLKSGVFQLSDINENAGVIRVRVRLDLYSRGSKDEHLLSSIRLVEGVVEFSIYNQYEIKIVKGALFEWNEILPYVDSILIEKIGTLRSESCPSIPPIITER